MGIKSASGALLAEVVQEEGNGGRTGQNWSAL